MQSLSLKPHILPHKPCGLEVLGLNELISKERMEQSVVLNPSCIYEKHWRSVY